MYCRQGPAEPKNSKCLFVGEVHGAVFFLAGGIDAGDEHHLVGIGRAHNLVVDILHIFLAVHRSAIDAGNHQAILDTGTLELAIDNAAHLHAARDVQVVLLLGSEFLESAAQ